MNDNCAGASRERIAKSPVCLAIMIATLLMDDGGLGSVRGQTQPTERLSFAENARVITHPGNPPDAPNANDQPPSPTVLAVAYSPDGAVLALGSENPVIALRSTINNRALGSLSGHTDTVTCLAFSPVNKLLASGGYDETVRLWNLADMTERTALGAHSGGVLAVAFSPDGKVLASAGFDKTITLWDVAESRKITSLAVHTGPVRTLGFAPDGKVLASAGSDRVVRLWDVEARTFKSTWDGHRGAVRALAFSPDGASLATAGEDHTVRLWDLATGKTRMTHTDDSDSVLTLAYSPKGDALVTGSFDGRLRVWSPPEHKSVSSLRAHHQGVTSLAFNPATGTLVSAGFDKAIKLWSPGARIATLRSTVLTSPRRFGEARYSTDGKLMITSELTSPGFGAIVRIWDTATWKELGSIAEDDGSNVFGNFSVDGRLISTTSRRAVRFWDPQRLTPLFSFATPGRPLPTTLAPDCSNVVYVDENGAIVMRKLPAPDAPDAVRAEAEQQTSKVLVKGQPDSIVQQLGRSPDLKSLIVTSITRAERTATFSLRDMSNGHEIVRKTEPGRDFARAFFAPDGKTVVGIFSDQQEETGDTTLVFWSATHWNELARMTVPSAAPTTLAFSPDGSRFAVASRQGIVYFWDAATRRPLGQFRAHDGVIVSVYFSPDGQSLATASTVQGEPVKIWDVSKTESKPDAKP